MLSPLCMSPAEKTGFIVINMLAVKSIFSGWKHFHTRRPKKKTINFNLRPEPPVDKALHSVSLCRCMLVVQLSSPGLAAASRPPADFIRAGVGSV